MNRTAIVAEVLLVGSKGKAAVFAKYVKSAIEFFNVKYCMFLVVNSAYGEDSPQ